MTCIVAHKNGWMVADEKCWTGVRPLPTKLQKILRFGDHTLVGWAGLGGATYLLKEAVEDPNYTKPEQVIKCLSEFLRHEKEQLKQEERHFLVVDVRRVITYIDSAGIPAELSEDYFAIGSGDDSAMGYMAGLNANPHRAGDFSALDATHAIRYASTRDLSVSYQTHTEYLV